MFEAFGGLAFVFEFPLALLSDNDEELSFRIISDFPAVDTDLFFVDESLCSDADAEILLRGASILLD